MYIVNNNTYYIYFDGNKTIVNELGIEFYYDYNIIKKILENSCLYYGSSFNGRIDGAKSYIQSKYLLPIIISDKNEIVLFPVKGVKNDEIIWFNLKYVKNYIKINEFVEIIFFNDFRKKYMISYNIFNNQILKASRLWYVSLNR